MVYDLIIIGTGPAGLTASIYASRYKINHLLIGSLLGGTITWAPEVENYPGFKQISGLELSKKMLDQAKSLGAEIKNTGVVSLSKKDQSFEVKTENNEIFEAKSLIIATGTQRQKLNIPGEKEYTGRGVSYCSTCDATFFKEKIVVVVGGSNAAVMSAVHLAAFAQKVYLIYRKKPLRAEPVWIEKIEKEPKVEIIYETNVTAILGDGQKVIGIKLDKSYQDNEQLKIDGIFIEVGGSPGTELVNKLGLIIDEKGYLEVQPDMKTNVPGVFGAGDVTNAGGEFRQVIKATAEGALASYNIYKFLKGGTL